jgi:Spy/CpxP family protein refolding chaperone
MKRTRLFAVALGMAVVFLSMLAGNGQENLGLAGPGESLRLALLRTSQVQKELKLTEEQKGKIARIGEQTKEFKKQVESAHGKGQEKGKPKAVDPAAKEAERLARDAMNADLAVVERQTDRQINAVLDTQQRARLTQIVLRVKGPSAFLTPELIDALNLGPDQVEMIREILDGMKVAQEQYKESQKRAFELVKGSGDFDLEKIRKEQQKGQTRAYAYKLSKQVMPQIGRVLTRRQREKYNRMIGESFDLAKLTGPEGQPLIDISADLGLSLLRQPAVREELKLTNLQKEQLDQGEPAAKVLDSRQRTRLNQIALQGEGPSALLRPEVVRVLRLSEEQVEQLQAILDDLLSAHQQLRESLKGAAAGIVEDDPERKAMRKEQEKAQLRAGSADLRGRTMQRINATLTRRQKEAFATLLGEPFDFARVRPQRPGP